MRAKHNKESTNTKSEESALTPLPEERKINQSTITSFFTNSPKRTVEEIDLPKPREEKGKEKVTEKTEKHDVRKLVPRKSTKIVQPLPILRY